MSSKLAGHREFKVRRRLLGLASAVSFMLLPSCNADAEAPAQEPTLPRAVWMEPVDSKYGSYRIVVEVDRGFLRSASKARGTAPLYLGDQLILWFNISGNLVYGFVEEAPQPADGVWSYLHRGSPATLEEARDIFVASGNTYVSIDFPALLSAGEQQRKRITDVRIETRTDAGPPETTIYFVKLVVENCTAENFIEPGASRPKVYVDDDPADSTFFSDEEELVVAEFSVRPEENGEITLRYLDWRLTAPAPFILQLQE